MRRRLRRNDCRGIGTMAGSSGGWGRGRLYCPRGEAQQEEEDGEDGEGASPWRFAQQDVPATRA